MELIDFSEEERLMGRAYRGNAGQKLAYLHEGAVWMVKFPQSTRNMAGKHLPSYTSSPLSEYIGSHIYGLLGIPVHETRLGRCRGKIVVACKDFAVNADLLGFHEIKNTVDEDCISGSFGSSARGERLSDVLSVIAHAEDFEGLRDAARERFWDMFVIDAFIRNGDRNNGNWGLLASRYAVDLAPVFDNGNSFFSKRNISVIDDRLADEAKIAEDIKTGCSFFTDDEDKSIHPFTYMSALENEDCTAALIRFAQRIDFGCIRSFIEGIPEEAFGLSVMKPSTKRFYLRILEAAIEQGFNPVLAKIGEQSIAVHA